MFVSKVGQIHRIKTSSTINRNPMIWSRNNNVWEINTSAGIGYGIIWVTGRLLSYIYESTDYGQWGSDGIQH